MSKTKRALALLLCLMMLITAFPLSVFAAEPAPFKDVKAGSWYYDDVAYVYEHELMNGVGNDLFAPNASTSRAMIVTILHRIEGSPAAKQKSTFTDLKSGSWYVDAVKWAAENKIVNGYSDKKFGPSDDITREQFAAILYRYAQFKEYDLSKSADLSAFPDAGNVSGWAKTAMSWANGTELIRGTGNGLDPRGTATRAQAAAILHRFLENIPPKPPVALTVTFDYNYEGAPEKANAEVISGEKAAKPDDPVRDEFDFLGWYLSPEGGEKYDFDAPVTENLVLYAAWADTLEENYYDVVFLPNNGTEGVVDMQHIQGGMKAEKPEDPVWEGFVFTGWFTDAALTTPYNFKAPVRQDLFLYAGWGSPEGGDGVYGTSTGGGTDFSITNIVEVDGGFDVTVNANYAAVLVLEIMDEESGELITTGAAETPEYCELEPVFVPVSGLPEHFDIRATLLNENGEELCNPYTTVRFTSAYEIYDAKTVNDFEGETVVNFDDEPDENFGVLADGVKIISTANRKNQITAEYNEILDEDGLVTDLELTGYRITNPNNAVKRLQPGDIIYIVDTTGIPLLFKLATIEAQDDGTYFVTQDMQGELTEYYSFLKADMTFGDEATAEPESAAEDGAVPLVDIIDVDDVSGSASLSMNFNYTHPNKSWFQVHATGSMEVEVSVTLLYDAHLFREDYFEASITKKTSTNLNLTFEFTNDYETGTGDNAQKHNMLKEYPIVPKQIIPTPIPGLSVNVKVTAPLTLTISGKVTVGYTADQTEGFTYNTDSGYEKIDKKSRSVTLNLEGEAELSISVKAKLTLGFCGEVVEIGVTGEGGAKVTATAVLQMVNETTSEKKHACQLCVDIKVRWFLKVSASLEVHIIEDVLDWEIFNLEFLNLSGPIPFPGSPHGSCFLSIRNDADSIYHGQTKFGFGECKNYQYRLTVKLHNAAGEDVDGTVTIKKKNTTLKSGAAPLMTHLYNGTYTVSATIDGTNVSRTVVISDAAKEIVLTPSSADGSIEGTVRDAESGNPIADAVVIISEGSTNLKSCKTDANGKFNAPVPAGTYKISISKFDYVPFITHETVTDGQSRVIETSLMINKAWNERAGGFSGTIRDAVTNNGLSGVSLALREGWNAPDSEHVLHRLTTDSNGYFEYRTGNLFGIVTGLEPGNYTLSATKQGYTPVKFNIVVVPGTVKGGQDATMTENVADDVYRVVLTWTGEPSDLDSHYTAMLTDGSLDHVYYSRKTGYSANLDRDDTGYEGPETVTVTDFVSLSNGFAYAVHDFSNRSSTDSTVLSNSGAKITLYKGANIVDTFSVPTDRVGTVWNVFTMDASGTVHTVNSFENISDPSNVGHAP